MYFQETLEKHSFQIKKLSTSSEGIVNLNIIILALAHHLIYVFTQFLSHAAVACCVAGSRGVWRVNASILKQRSHTVSKLGYAAMFLLQKLRLNARPEVDDVTAQLKAGEPWLALKCM